MRLYLALLTCYGKEYLGDTMADVILDDVTHEERGDVYADDGIDQEKRVRCLYIELIREEVLYVVYEVLEEQSGKGGEYAHDEAHEQDGLGLAEVHASPDEETLDEGIFIVCGHGMMCCVQEIDLSVAMVV